MNARSAALDASLSACGLAKEREAVQIPLNEDSFAVFYQGSVRPLWAYLARVSGNPSLADDLVQESFIRFLSAKAPWDQGETACRRYLFRIGTNLLRDHWRRPKTLSIEDVPEGKLPAVAPGEIDSSASNPFLNAALRRLRPVERQLLWLAHAEEMSHRDISVITGLGTARIRLALFRSRRKLARALRQEMIKSGGAR